MSGEERPVAGGVTVRYWAALRAAAGTSADEVPPGPLDQVLASVAAGHADDPRFGQVLAICSTLVDEVPLGARRAADVDVAAGSIVDLLPPFAGGCRNPHRETVAAMCQAVPIVPILPTLPGGLL